MGRSGSCKVCAHPEVAEIDRRKAAGEPERSLAAAFDLRRGTISTHWKRCRKGGKAMPLPSVALAPVALAPDALALPPAEIPAGHPVAPLLAQLAEIHGHALEAYRSAVDRKDVNQQILLLPQLRGNLKAQEAMLAKVEQPKDETERLLGHPDFLETALCAAAALDVPASGGEEWRAGWAAARAAYVAELERLVGELPS